MTSIGTFISINNRPYAPQPQHSFAHALISGVAMVAFVLVGLAWLAAC